MRFLQLWQKNRQLFITGRVRQSICPKQLLLLNSRSSQQSFIVLPLLLESGDEFLLELPKENIGSLDLPLEAFVGRLEIHGGFSKFQRNMVHVITKFLVVRITII